jgi:predicted esterase
MQHSKIQWHIQFWRDCDEQFVAQAPYEFYQLPTTTLTGKCIWALQPTEAEHTHTLIYLHGFGEDVTTYQKNFFLHETMATFPGLAVLLPSGAIWPHRSASGCYRTPGWYGYMTSNIDDDVNDGYAWARDDMVPGTIERSVAVVHTLIRQELRRGKTVLVGGYSQGCGTALHAISCLQPHEKVAASLLNCGEVLPETFPYLDVLPNRCRSFTVNRAGDDKFFPWRDHNGDRGWAQDGWAQFDRCLSQHDVEIDWREHPGIGHILKDYEGVLIRAFLSRHLPAPTRAAQAALRTGPTPRPAAP